MNEIVHRQLVNEIKKVQSDIAWAQHNNDYNTEAILRLGLNELTKELKKIEITSH